MLVDTSVLARLQQPHSRSYETCLRALGILKARGVTAHIVPQNLIELWVVCTRPTTSNGFGFTAGQTALELERLQSIFILLPHLPETFTLWQNLVLTHRITGKPAHDAHLVAAMTAHRIRRILTFDAAGFARFPGIEVLHPDLVA